MADVTAEDRLAQATAITTPLFADSPAVGDWRATGVSVWTSLFADSPAVADWAANLIVPPQVTHYALTAICTTDSLRHYWTDTTVSLAAAPPCVGGYVAGSLTILTIWRT
jgi:hypothetical protein